MNGVKQLENLASIITNKKEVFLDLFFFEKFTILLFCIIFSNFGVAASMLSRILNRENRCCGIPKSFSGMPNMFSLILSIKDNFGPLCLYKNNKAFETSLFPVTTHDVVSSVLGAFRPNFCMFNFNHETEPPSSFAM